MLYPFIIHGKEGYTMAKYLNSDGLTYFLKKLKPLMDNKANTNHTHNYAGSSSAGGAANSVANSLSIQLNGGTATVYNGSAAKNINITSSSIGAAASNHSHNSITKYGDNTINSTKNDTTSNWVSKGISAHFYSTDGSLNNQPSQHGFLLNLGGGADVHQIWMQQPSGILSHRGGNGDGWSGTWKTILDSSNFTTYVLSDSVNKLRFFRKIIADGSAKKWVCLGIVKISSFGRTTIIDFWTGKGFNGSSSQNSHINISIKKAWQATASTTKACGVVVRCFNCAGVDVKVVATAHDTYKVYMYNPWDYPSGPMEVHGDYTTFTSSDEILSSAPTGALQEVAIYHMDNYLKLDGNQVLSGGNYSGQFNIQNSDAKDLGITVTNTTKDVGKSVALRIGSTKTNRGIYDVSGNKWMIYSDENNSVKANLSTYMTIKYSNGDTVASYNGSANTSVTIPKITSGTSLPGSGKNGDIFVLY